MGGTDKIGIKDPEFENVAKGFMANQLSMYSSSERQGPSDPPRVIETTGSAENRRTRTRGAKIHLSRRTTREDLPPSALLPAIDYDSASKDCRIPCPSGGNTFAPSRAIVT